MSQEVISLVGILVGIILLMLLALKGHSIIWAAPLCAVVVAIFSGANILDSYLTDYMSGVGGYLIQWFPAFMLGAVYGKIMEVTGAAKSLSDKICSVIGPKYALLAVVVPAMLMTYGGISMFVVIFTLLPMAYSIYRNADIPRFLIPGAISLGCYTITMTVLPGSPQNQNLIPTSYYGTDAMAGPLVGIASAIIIFAVDYLYLQRKINKVKASGQHFVADPDFVEPDQSQYDLPSWHWLSGLIPLIVVVLVLNLLPHVAGLTAAQSIIIALICGILTCLLMNLKQHDVFSAAVSQGAISSLTAIMNTSCAVGFGAVVKVVPGFAFLSELVLGLSAGVLLTQSLAVNILAGATGSASGGMGIVLESMGDQFMERAAASGISNGILHRICSMSSGGLDTLPHNGAVNTLLSVSHTTHKESYWDICVTSCIVPLITSIGVSILLDLIL